jgi:hypothetical protein
MRSKLKPTTQPGLSMVAIAGMVALLAGCMYGRVQDFAEQVESRYLGAPVARALGELGLPNHDYPIADLHSYVWETGRQSSLGGNCTLSLVADRRGTVVDYDISGTPLGCRRLLTVS